jgi:pilus assembly protein CpaC
MVTHKISFINASSVFIAICLSLTLVFPPIVLAQIQDVVDSSKEDNVFLYVGDLITVKVKSLTRVAVANPGVVDITNATADEMTLIGRKVGETQIFIWDEGGKKQLLARVVSIDLNLILTRMASLIQSSGIHGVSLEKNYFESKIILSGSLNKNDKKKLDEILKGFSDTVINLVIEEGDLIQIDVQFSELDTTLTKALGFDWSAGSGGTLAFNFQETLPTQDGSFMDLFKIGDFARTSAILSVVNLLIQEGKGRILSKPSLVVTSGEKATFLVGGEIPVRSTTTSVGGGTVQENVTFKDYGVDLTITPELMDGKIDIKVKVTVRDIDASNAVGEDVAFLTRTVTTKVKLADTQTIVLAGMIQRRRSEQIKRVPFLSTIPVLGMLFKSKGTVSPDSDQELVISLTPHVLKNLPVGKTVKNFNDGSQSDAIGKDAMTESLLENKDLAAKNQKGAVERIQKESTSADVPSIVSDIKAAPLMTAEKKTAAQKKSRAEARAAAIKIKKDKIAKLKEEKAAKKKAQKDARDAAIKLRKEKADRLKAEKAAEKKTREEARAAAKLKKGKGEIEKNIKTTERQSVQKSDKKLANSEQKILANVDEPKKQASVQDFSLEKDKLKSAVDPSLNMWLDDPNRADPQNILSDDEIAAVKDKYLKRIKGQMAESISYPYQAKESQWEGTAVIDITILPDGDVKNVVVSKSSGYAIFDKDAVNTAEILSPFDPFMPAKNLRELIVTVPVEYSEKAILRTFAPAKK